MHMHRYELSLVYSEAREVLEERADIINGE